MQVAQAQLLKVGAEELQRGIMNPLHTVVFFGYAYDQAIYSTELGGFDGVGEFEDVSTAFMNPNAVRSL